MKLPPAVALVLTVGGLCAAAPPSLARCVDLPTHRVTDGTRRAAIDRFADQAAAEGADAVLVMIEGRVAVARGAIAEPMLTASIRLGVSALAMN